MPADISAILKKESGDLDDFLVVVTSSAKGYSKTSAGVIKYFQKQKIPGIYVTLNKPYDIIERSLKKGGIDTRLIIFIDGATQKKQSERVGSTLFVGSPEKLSDISVAIDQSAKSLPSPRFLFFDSIDSLLVFNNAPTVGRFLHYLSAKIRELKLKGVVISLNSKSNQEILDELTQLSDLRIDKGG